MKISRRKTPWVLALAIFGGLTVFLALYQQAQVARRLAGERLQLSIAQMPTGIAADEAERRLGGGPDWVSQQSGVMANNVTLLAATNVLAKPHGKPQLYEVRLWERGGVKAAVVVDSQGRVAGRYTWK